MKCEICPEKNTSWMLTKQELSGVQEYYFCSLECLEEWTVGEITAR